MFGINKKMFIVLLTGTVGACNHRKSVSISSEKCMTQPCFINLHPKECSQEFHYYPFAVELERSVVSCNVFNDLSNKVCVPHKTEDLRRRFKI